MKKEAKLKAKEEAGKPTESLSAAVAGQRRPSNHVRRRARSELPWCLLSDALDKINKLNPGTVATVLLVVGFCMVQQMFLECLLAYVFAPDPRRTWSPDSRLGWAAAIALPP